MQKRLKHWYDNQPCKRENLSIVIPKGEALTETGCRAIICLFEIVKSWSKFVSNKCLHLFRQQAKSVFADFESQDTVGQVFKKLCYQRHLKFKPFHSSNFTFSIRCRLLIFRPIPLLKKSSFQKTGEIFFTILPFNGVHYINEKINGNK
jgi:hypothetical protein